MWINKMFLYKYLLVVIWFCILYRQTVVKYFRHLIIKKVTMAHHILTWIKLRWRLLFIIIVPLVLLPLPLVGQTPVCFLFLWELIFNNFLLASKMWLYCPYSYYLLDFGSHSINSDIIITTHIVSHGKQNSFFTLNNFWKYFSCLYTGWNFRAWRGSTIVLQGYNRTVLWQFGTCLCCRIC